MNGRLFMRRRINCPLWQCVCSQQPAVAGVAVLAMLLTIGGNVSAQAPSHDVPAATVRRLIEQLDAESRSTRVAAERQLQELGPDILSQLPAPDRLRSPAAQDAVRRVRELLEREQAQRSVRPSRVILMGSFPLSDIVQQISTQTENEIDTTALPPEALQQTIELQLHDVTFWECLDVIDRRDDLAVRFGPEDGILEIVPQSEAAEGHSVRTASTGAFLITVRDVSLRPDFTDPTRNIVRVRYEVAAEPRLRPLFIRVSNAEFRLKAQAPDVTFPPLDKDARRERPADRPGPVPLSVDFVVPASRMIDHVSMTGRVAIELAAAQEAFVFRNLDTAERVVRRHGGVTVTLDRAVFDSKTAPGAEHVRINLRVVYDQGGPAFESHRTWVYHNDAALRAADGSVRWSHTDFETQAAAEAAVKLSYQFEDVTTDPATLEFVYTAPTLLLTVPVEFELPDLPVESSLDEERPQ